MEVSYYKGGIAEVLGNTYNNNRSSKLCAPVSDNEKYGRLENGNRECNSVESTNTSSKTKKHTNTSTFSKAGNCKRKVEETVEEKPRKKKKFDKNKKDQNINIELLGFTPKSKKKLQPSVVSNLSEDQEDNAQNEINARTLFVGNLPLKISKKDIKTLFKCYGKVEKIRFRSAVPAKPGLSKKAAIITQNFHEQKNSINSYVIMDSVESAKKALSTNGLLLDDHHIRVDFAENKKYEKNVTVFVGNLPYSCQDEELYLFFNKKMAVDAVRVVRDSETGICKGFGFVIFTSKDSVELALKMNEEEFKGRLLRVKRIQNQKKNINYKNATTNEPLSKRRQKIRVPFEGTRSKKDIKERKRMQKKIKKTQVPSSKKPTNNLSGVERKRAFYKQRTEKKKGFYKQRAEKKKGFYKQRAKKVSSNT